MLSKGVSAQVELKGKLINCNDCQVEVIIDHSNFDADKQFINSKPDHYGNFVFDLREIHEATSLVLDVSGQRFPIFVKPNTQIWFTVTGPKKAVQLQFDQGLIKENEYLRHIVKEYGWVGDRLYSGVWFENNYVGVSQNIANAFQLKGHHEQVDYLLDLYGQLKMEANGLNSAQFDPDFSNFMSTYITHAAPAMVYNMASTTEIDSLSQARIAQEMMSFFDENQRNSPAYIPHLKSLLTYQMHVNNIPRDDFNQSFTFLYKNDFNVEKSLKREYLLHILKKRLNASTVQNLKPILEEFISSLSNLDQIAELMLAYDKAIRDANGLKAPNFTLQDKTGNLVSLASFKGQNVYLAFWSSSCGPCISGMKKSVKNKERLNNDNIKFIYVSTDLNKATWLANKYVQSASANDVHLWIGKSKPELHHYNAISLPTYYFINKQGQFVTKFPKSWEVDFVPFVRNQH